MSQSPEQEGGLSPVAFDRDGLRLSVEPESRPQSKPQTPTLTQSQEAFPSVEVPRSSLAVLIIKPHAVKQRLKIEKRIVEAGFEIVKERKMRFQLDSPGVVGLFAADAPSLSGDPVWVYVLSRARSASALVALTGPADPLAARKSDPDSLRALYGSNRWENGVWITRDEASAEHMVNDLFPGSPMMEFSDLPSANSSPARKVRKATSHTSSLRSDITGSTGTKGLSGSGSRASLAAVSKAGFKARPVPTTTAVPSMTPRTTRAASLRAGNVAPPAPRPRMSQEERERTFEGVPGHKRRESIAVASTAPPTIAPRPNRSAMLRAQKLAEGSGPKTPKRPSTSDGLGSKHKKAPLSPEEAEEKKRATFEGVPGHKRRESISVPSTAPPAVSPRVNRSSMLRTQKLMGGGSGGPPSAFKGAPEGSPAPAPTRSLSTRSSRTSISGLTGSGSISKASGAAARPGVKIPSSASRSSLAPPSGTANSGALTPISNGAMTPRSATASQPAKAPASPKKPDIVPRTNKSALLRAAAKLKSAAGNVGSMGKGPVGRKSLAI